MFSIVIPLYNKSHTILRTLKSVLNQTFQEFEVIIINDGSTDDGVDIINDFTSDARIKIFSQLNQGVSVARNNGVLYASYDYIAFLDGDDEWLPQYLSKMKQAIDDFPLAGMFCCAGYVKDLTSESLRIANKYKGKIAQIDYFENPHVYTHISATVIKKQTFEKTQGFPVGMKKNEDFALLFLVAIADPVVYCGEPLSIYWGGVPGQTTQNQGTNNFLQDIVNRFNICRESFKNSHQKSKLFIIFQKYEIRHYILTFIKNEDYLSIEFLIKQLSPVVLSDFSKLEVFLWKAKKIKLLTYSLIYSTKLIWRLNGYPVVHRG
jgi:glycosyltransferase involved in cell wall biosynthesis